MSKKQAWSTKYVAAMLLMGVGYALPAAAITCPHGEEPAKDGKTCTKWEAPKPQLDVSKYEGAQKQEAEACNKLNQAKTDGSTITKEIESLSSSIDTHYVEYRKLPKGAEKDKVKGEIDKLKADRKAAEAKLGKAKSDMTAGKKEVRAAKKALKKEKKESLNCA